MYAVQVVCLLDQPHCQAGDSWVLLDGGQRSAHLRLAGPFDVSEDELEV